MQLSYRVWVYMAAIYLRTCILRYVKQSASDIDDVISMNGSHPFICNNSKMSLVDMATQSTQSSSTNSASNELTSDDLAVLCNALNDVAPKSFELGLQLGLRKANIEIIMKNNKDDCQAQLREIISERLKQDLPLTWHDIVRALRSPSINHPHLARHIDSWYISPALDLQQHPQQHLSLGGERPYTMVIDGSEYSQQG